jgi:outer membrane protein TolC
MIMRNQAIKNLTCSAVMIVCMTALTGCVSSQAVQEAPVTDNAQANDDIIEMYQDLIKLRQKVLAENVKLSDYGRGNVVEFVDAKVKVSEARIQLARFEGQQDVVIGELRNIVKLYTEVKEALEKEVKTGQRPNVYVDEMEIRLLEAKIRLARAIQEK